MDKIDEKQLKYEIDLAGSCLKWLNINLGLTGITREKRVDKLTFGSYAVLLKESLSEMKRLHDEVAQMKREIEDGRSEEKL